MPRPVGVAAGLPAVAHKVAAAAAPALETRLAGASAVGAGHVGTAKGGQCLLSLQQQRCLLLSGSRTCLPRLQQLTCCVAVFPHLGRQQRRVWQCRILLLVRTRRWAATGCCLRPCKLLLCCLDSCPHSRHQPAQLIQGLVVLQAGGGRQRIVLAEATAALAQPRHCILEGGCTPCTAPQTYFPLPLPSPTQPLCQPRSAKSPTCAFASGGACGSRPLPCRRRWARCPSDSCASQAAASARAPQGATSTSRLNRAVHWGGAGREGGGHGSSHCMRL